jgi:site-specific DNA recombinase
VAKTAKPVRCAVYTRKSTEEGLDQEFSSLDAQREAAQAYIKSQTCQGWTCLKTPYDDGGFTGGNMERPALQRLLTDIQAGKVDCVVVYKVDRLSRSLLDFARMMETFEQHHVAFVSVTQQFNTAHSMGRLVLKVLLSFAQFEREIISERTRDKIATARRKGKWCGGLPLLGYDVDPQGSKLVVNDREAKQVQAIFALYLECGGLLSTVQELAKRGWTNKHWQTRTGTCPGRLALYQGEPASFADQCRLPRQGQIQERSPLRRTGGDRRCETLAASARAARSSR